MLLFEYCKHGNIRGALIFCGSRAKVAVREYSNTRIYMHDFLCVFKQAELRAVNLRTREYVLG